MLWNIHLSNS